MHNFLEQFKQWSIENLPEKIMEALPHLVSFIIIIVIGFWLSSVVGKLFVKLLEKRNVDASMHRFLMRSIIVFLRVIVSVIALEQIGISVNSFVTAIGAAGITAGLGLQNSISQFASGVQILFNKPFKSGDYVKLNEVEGKVKEIRFMYTTLITNDNKTVVVPNLNITTSNLINYSAQGTMRIDLVYFISYNDDIERAKKVLMNVATSNSNVIKNPKPFVGVNEHGASGIGMTLFVWVDSNNYWDTYFKMQEEVKLAFDKNGISIPYDQLDVHIKQK